MNPAFGVPPIYVRSMNLGEVNRERARSGRRALTEAEFDAIPLQAALTWLPEPAVEPGPVNLERIVGLINATAVKARAAGEPTQESAKNSAESERILEELLK